MELEWLVHYNDGGTLPQFNEKLKENKYNSIKRNKVVRFTICGHRIIGDRHIQNPIISFEIDPKKQWWFRRITAMEVEIKNTNLKSKKHYYVFGVDGSTNTVINSDGIVIESKMLRDYKPPIKDYELVF